MEEKIIEEKVKKEKVQKDVMKEINNFPSLEGKFLHVKVGDAERPADDDAIIEVQDQLDKLFKEHKINCITYVSHHAVEIIII